MSAPNLLKKGVSRQQGEEKADEKEADAFSSKTGSSSSGKQKREKETNDWEEEDAVFGEGVLRRKEPMGKKC